MRKCAAVLCAAAMAAAAFGEATTKPVATVIDTSSEKGGVVAQSAPHSDGYNASHVFDGNDNDMYGRWLAKTNSLPVYFVYKFNSATVVDGLRIHICNNWYPVDRAPNTWKFWGSQTGEDGSWQELDSRSGVAWSSGQTRTFGFANKTAYQYYKFTCTKNNGGDYVQLWEMWFLSGSLRDHSAADAGEGSVYQQSEPFVYENVSYPADNLFNGKNDLSSRWLTATTNNYFVYKFNEPTAVNAISVTVPNQGATEQRSPKTWTFSGSADGSAWTTLDTQTGETGWIATGEERYYRFDNNKKYTYYKFDCTATNGQTPLQIVEMEFYFDGAGVPVVDSGSVTRRAGGGYDVSATVAVATADSVKWIARNGTSEVSGIVSSDVAEGSTVTATLTGLADNTTYEVSVATLSGEDVTDTVVVGTIYTGELTLGAVVNASEDTLTAGTVAVSRANADNVPLTVYYTITAGAGTAGVTWEEPVAVTIPAGASTASLTVTPLIDLTVSADLAVTVALAAGNYAISGADGSKTLTIVNSDTPAGFYSVTITNAFENPVGGFFRSSLKQVFTNSSDCIYRFAPLGSGENGLREFVVDYSDNIESAYANRDWLHYAAAASTPKSASTQQSVRIAEAEITSGVTAKRTVYTYAGCWYIPETETYSFRMNMGNYSVFSLDGRLILLQGVGGTAVTTNGVALSAGWHNFCASFVARGNSAKIGPATGETIAFSFSSENADLTKASPGLAFSSDNCQFKTAFNAVSLPYLSANGGNVIFDCANVVGDLRIAGVLAARNGTFSFVNFPAGRTLEFGRPVRAHTGGYYLYQDLTAFSFVDWSKTSIPSGVNVRFEGAIVVNDTWATSGPGSYTLGKHVSIATSVPNFFGELTDEFHYPDGLVLLQVARPEVLGQTAKVYVPDGCGFGVGGTSFGLSSSSDHPVVAGDSSKTFENDIDLGNDAAINGSLIWNSSHVLAGDITGDGGLKLTGWSHRIIMRGRVTAKDGVSGQRGCRLNFLPKAGKDPSSLYGTVTLSGELDTSYMGSCVFYGPETPGEQPFSIGKVDAVDADWVEGLAYGGRRGATIMTCSNNTVNVGSLVGKGAHLRAVIPPSGNPTWTASTDVEKFGPANFVFGEINGANGSNPMPIFVSSNVNVTVTNIAKSAAFHYEVMSNGVNAAVLDIEGTVADGTTITATDVAMLPARIKGFTGHDITLTDTTPGRTYPVVFDFDQKGGIPIGGCDGSGTLAAAPASGTIELSFAGMPPDRGEWGLLRFDSANGLLNGWTVNAPTSYTVNGKKYGVRVSKDDKGFAVALCKFGVFVIVR